MNLLDLSRKFKKLAKDFDKKVNLITIEYAEKLLHELIAYTPVDTSKALSNWRVNFNEPLSGQAIEPHYPGVFGTTHAKSADKAYKLGYAILQSKRVGDTIYISNLADYIVDLDQGTSDRAPYGIVNLATLAASRRFKGVKVELLE